MKIKLLIYKKATISCFFVCLTYILVSCDNGKENVLSTIVVEPDKALSIDLNDSSGTEYLTLESISNAYFKDIKNILFINDTLILFGYEKISAFNSSGKYLFDYTQKGEGPEEFISLRSVFFKNGTLYLYDNSSYRMLLFTPSGKFIKYYRVFGNGYNSSQIMSFPDSEEYIGLTIFKGMPNTNTPLFSLYDKNFKITKTSSDLIKTSFLNPAFSLVPSGDGFLYNGVWSYDISLVDKKLNVVKKYTVDFGKYAIPSYIYDNGPQSIANAVQEKNTDLLDKCYIGYISDTPHRLFFTCYQNGVKIVSYDKTTGMTKVFAPLFPKKLVPWMFFKIIDNKAVMIVENSDSPEENFTLITIPLIKLQ